MKFVNCLYFYQLYIAPKIPEGERSKNMIFIKNSRRKKCQESIWNSLLQCKEKSFQILLNMIFFREIDEPVTMPQQEPQTNGFYHDKIILPLF